MVRRLRKERGVGYSREMWARVVFDQRTETVLYVAAHDMLKQLRAARADSNTSRGRSRLPPLPMM